MPEGTKPGGRCPGLPGTGGNRQTSTLSQPHPAFPLGSKVQGCCLSELPSESSLLQPWKRPSLPAGLRAGIDVGLGAGLPVARLPGLGEPCKPPPASRPEVFPVVEVPGGRVAHHLPPVAWLLQHGFRPELGWHGQEPQGGEELLRHPEHVCGVPALGVEGWGGHTRVRGQLLEPTPAALGVRLGSPTRVSSMLMKSTSAPWPPFPEAGPLLATEDTQKRPAARCHPPLPAGS